MRPAHIRNATYTLVAIHRNPYLFPEANDGMCRVGFTSLLDLAGPRARPFFVRVGVTAIFMYRDM